MRGPIVHKHVVHNFTVHRCVIPRRVMHRHIMHRHVVHDLIVHRRVCITMSKYVSYCPIEEHVLYFGIFGTTYIKDIKIFEALDRKRLSEKSNASMTNACMA